METIFVPLAVFGFPAAMVVLLVWIKNKERIKRYELQADLYAKALEKGETIPDNLFEPAYMKYSKEEKMAEKEEYSMLKRNALSVSIILMIVGFAISLFMWVVAFLIGQIDFVREDVPMYIRAGSAAGIIPFLIGIAFMIIHLIEKKKDH
ncbi:MAG: DUF6249 domain-containing protein [Bacteroidales bacterium]|nr:DUF6249 domain-containing protein [Bacteroidales bacterium]